MEIFNFALPPAFCQYSVPVAQPLFKDAEKRFQIYNGEDESLFISYSGFIERFYRKAFNIISNYGQ